jgi:hypothetical protein
LVAVAEQGVGMPRYLLALIIATVMIYGCGATSSSAGSALPATSIAPGTSPLTSPDPLSSLDPEAVRKDAAAAYLVAANRSNADQKALNKKFPANMSLKQAHAYYKAWALISGRFIAAIKKIVVPADTAADMHALIARVASTQASQIEMSTVKSADYETAGKVLAARGRAWTAAANLIRVDLGLPAVK